MAADLAGLDEKPAVPDGFSIRQATDPADLELWSRVCADGFEMPDFARDGFCDFMLHADQNTLRAYIGFLNGEPVATSLLSLAAGVAGVYNVTTIGSARRQGIGARMTDLPLLETRSEGYKAAILHASEMGMGVYRALGFKEYCKLDQYLWSPA